MGRVPPLFEGPGLFCAPSGPELLSARVLSYLSRRPDATTRPLLRDGAVVSIYPANDNVVRPSPVDDLDRFCAPAPFVQDGTSPFYGFFLADLPSGVDPHATFVVTRVTGEDNVDAVVARLFLLRALSGSTRKYAV